MVTDSIEPGTLFVQLYKSPTVLSRSNTVSLIGFHALVNRGSICPCHNNNAGFEQVEGKDTCRMNELTVNVTMFQSEHFRLVIRISIMRQGVCQNLRYSLMA